MGPPVIDPTAVTAVLDRYGERPMSALHNLRLARRSTNVVIRTERGLRVLKCYRPQWGTETVRYGHSILLRLAAQHVPAVRLAMTQTGDTLVHSDDRVFAVFEFAAGINYSLNFLRRRDRLMLTRMAAATPARLHRSGERFVPAGRHHLGFTSLSGPRPRDLAWHTTTVDELVRRSAQLPDATASRLAGALVQRSEQLLEELSRLDCSLGAADLPRLVIHGDYGLHNLLFKFDSEPTRVVPVDFEVARLDWRIDDLVSALGKFRYRGGHYDSESMRTFITSYAANFPLTEGEVQLLPDVWRFHKLQAAVQYWNSYFETSGPVRKLASALDALDQAQWVIDRPGLVTKLAHSCRTARRAPPLTVLQVTPNLEIGGAQENLRTMARHLPAAGCPTVVCTFDDGPLRGDVERLGVPVEVLPGRRHSVVALPMFVLEMRRLRRRLLEVVARHGADVVQTRGLGTLDFLVATLALARPSSHRFSRRTPLANRIAVWWTIENVQFMVRPEHLSRRSRWLLGPKRSAHRALYRAGARVVDGIIVVSDDTERSFRRSVGYRGDKLHVVTNAADVTRFEHEHRGTSLRAEFAIGSAAHMMTMVGTFKRQKGHAVLIAALRTVVTARPELHAVLVGDGELLPAIRAEVAASELTSHVHFAGSRRDVDALLAASDSFVLPSLWEGLPVALVEAMASGLPVVATDVSGTRDVMIDGATGWLVPPGDADALARAITEMLADPERAATMGRAGRRRVASRFTAAQQAERLATLFRADAHRLEVVAR
jgi:glycosyltransferase involved in cell wall biosynthesis/Ser/Thr protein kinase RdoA (MazF antagonist)